MTEIPDHLRRRAEAARRGAEVGPKESVSDEKVMDEFKAWLAEPELPQLPPNSIYPWNDLVDVAARTLDPSQAIILNMGMNAIHEQLCVIADLLRQGRH